MNVCCIADEETVRGFRLAGIGGQAVSTAEEAAAALARVEAESDCGIVIMTDDVAAGIRWQVDTLRMEKGRPLIVTVPCPLETGGARKSLRQYVQEAVGMSLDIQGSE